MDLLLIGIVAAAGLGLFFLEEILTFFLKALIWVLLISLVMVFIFNLSLPQILGFMSRIVLYAF